MKVYQEFSEKSKRHQNPGSWRPETVKSLQGSSEGSEYSFPSIKSRWSLAGLQAKQGVRNSHHSEDNRENCFVVGSIYEDLLGG